MAYKQKGCNPITAKIKRTTVGGVVQPLLKTGEVSPLKVDGKIGKIGKTGKTGKIGKVGKVGEIGKIGKGDMEYKPKTETPSKNEGSLISSTYKKASELYKKYPNASRVEVDSSGNTSVQYSGGEKGGSMTPFSIENGKGKIHGPKVDYNTAYKNRNMKTYGNMSKSEYIKEAKRQTDSFLSGGNWDAKKPRKKQATVKTSKPAETKSISTDNKLSTANISAPKANNVKVSNKTNRKVKSLDKKLSKASEARAAGNIKKAERKEKRAAKKAARIAKKNTPAKMGCKK